MTLTRLCLPVGSSDLLPDDAAFAEAVRIHGRDFKSICRHLGMRGVNAAKHHYYKHRMRLGLDAIMADREAVPRGDVAVDLAEEMEVEDVETGGDLSSESLLRHK